MNDIDNNTLISTLNRVRSEESRKRKRGMWKRIATRMNAFSDRSESPDKWRSLYRRATGTHTTVSTSQPPASDSHPDTIDEDLLTLDVFNTDSVDAKLPSPSELLALHMNGSTAAEFRKAVTQMSDEDLDNFISRNQNVFGKFDDVIKDLPAHKKCLVIPDCHAPFQHQSLLAIVEYAIIKEKPDIILLIGDVYDRYIYGAWPKTGKYQNASTEILLAKAFVTRLDEIFEKYGYGNGDIFVTIGNHDDRLYRLMLNFGLDADTMSGLADYLGFPKHWDVAHQWWNRPANLQYIHVPPAAGKASYQLTAERVEHHTVYGHLHTQAGVAQVRGRVAGCCGANIRYDTYAMQYAAKGNREVASRTLGYMTVGTDQFISTPVIQYHNLLGSDFDI